MFIKGLLSILLVCFVSTASAGVAFTFQNAELTKMIEVYAKASVQKIIFDSTVRGVGSILSADDVSVDEAYSLLSEILANHGYAFIKHDNTLIVRSARLIQRDSLEVTNKLPELKPMRMVTYIVQLQNVPAEAVNRDLRILASREGEVSVLMAQNSLIISDWTSNIMRLHAMIQEIDKPQNIKISKMLEAKRAEFRKLGGAHMMLPPPPRQGRKSSPSASLPDKGTVDGETEAPSENK